MRILQLCTKVPYPPMDGGAASIYVFTKAFAALGHTVHVLAFNPQKHFIHESEFKRLPQIIKIHPVNINTTPRWGRALRNLLLTEMPYLVERFIDKEYANKLVKIIHLLTPDIVQIEGIYMCPYIPLIRKHSSAKIVLRAHNIEHILWDNIAENEHNLLKKIYFKIQSSRLKKYEIKQLTKVDGVTTFTENDLSILEEHVPKTIARVIPFGVDILTSFSEVKPNLNALFFLGALDWIPNQEAVRWFVTGAWPQIRKELPNFEFHIAGRNAPRSLITILKDQPGIFFHGEISDSRLFIEQFTIAVIPLFSGSGIRVKIIEAMEQGKVVIASSKAVSGIPAVAGKHLFLAESADDYICHIKNLISNPNLLKEITDNAMDFVRERFNILAITTQLINFYQEISMISK